MKPAAATGLLDICRALACRLVVVALFMVGLAETPGASVASAQVADLAAVEPAGAHDVPKQLLLAAAPGEIESTAWSGGEDERSPVAVVRPAWRASGAVGCAVAAARPAQGDPSGFDSRAPPRRV